VHAKDFVAQFHDVLAAADVENAPASVASVRFHVHLPMLPAPLMIS
jgi:hypothetical protein